MVWQRRASISRLLPVISLVHPLLSLFVNSYAVAAFAVSIISFCVGCVFFYGAVKEEYGASIAEKSLTLLLLYPFSFFFGGIMTESLFFCLISAGFSISAGING